MVSKLRNQSPRGYVVCRSASWDSSRRAGASRRDKAARRRSRSFWVAVSGSSLLWFTRTPSWMSIICAIITIPVGLVGYFIIPGTIDKPNRYVLSEKDLAVPRSRLNRCGHKTQGKLRLRHINRIFSSKHFWIVVLVDILFWNAGINSGAFLLWLKSLKRYNSAKVNEYGTIPPATGILFTLAANFSSDLLWGPVW